jgi:hypothetical protein
MSWVEQSGGHVLSCPVEPTVDRIPSMNMPKMTSEDMKFRYRHRRAIAGTAVICGSITKEKGLSVIACFIFKRHSNAAYPHMADADAVSSSTLAVARIPSWSSSKLIPIHSQAPGDCSKERCLRYRSYQFGRAALRVDATATLTQP